MTHRLMTTAPGAVSAARRWWLPIAVVGLGIVAPLLLTGRYPSTIAMQIWIAAAYAYSYRLLFGGTGMLSFGHAVQFGIGAFSTAHALNTPGLAAVGFPAEAVPLVGVAAGLGAAVVFGYPATRRSGTPFAMVTLGIGELVAACFLMFPGFFGGESGISTDRSALPGLVVGSYGSISTLYPLVVAWAIALIAAALWIGRTPLGLLARAVRDNADRIGFLGFEPASIRFRVFLIGGALAGGAGALAAMLYEIVAVESVSVSTSANVLLMTVVGGATSAIGPLLGAVTLTAMQTVLAKFTPAWAFYHGLLFVIVVLFAPRGIAGVFAALRDDVAANGVAAVARRRAESILLATVAVASAVVMIETIFRRTETVTASAVTTPLTAGLAGIVLVVAAARLAGLGRRAP